MLIELSVRDLGVIEDCTVTFGTGMTALTGETGAGKTLLISAVALLVGGRSDSTMVRAGASEARVEGRFIDESGEERILTRVVPVDGRSRSYLDGRMVSAAELSELGEALVDIYGQHGHQALLSPVVQRSALDRYGEVDVEGLHAVRQRIAEVDARLANLGGDSRERAREMDLLSYQLSEIDAAGLLDPHEASSLEAMEEALAHAVAHREAANAAYDRLVRDGGTTDLLGEAIHHLVDRGPFADVHTRLVGVAAELDDLTSELRAIGERLDDDPSRLEEVRQRRQLIRDLCRRYGESIDEVNAYADRARSRMEQLATHEEQVAALEAQREVALGELLQEQAKVASARRASAPRLSAIVEEILSTLAMPRARFHIEVAGDAGENVQFQLAANPGEDFAPLSKSASGGELARTMLALRLATLESRTSDRDLTDVDRTLIFDEVDAGIGGETAQVVGQALASVASGAQVLVVTHLAQVAACAHAHVSVTKADLAGRTVARAVVLDPDDRVIELSRMLSGRPDSETARDHARELLDVVSTEMSGR